MKKILKFIPLTITVTAVIAFVYYSVRNLEKTLIENSLMKIEPIFLAVTFIGIISFIFLNRKDIISFFRKIPKTTWLLLFGIFILALILRAAITPATHRVYFDEDIYLDIGKEILLRGNGSLCNYGDTECHEYAFMKWPNAYPTILAGSYAIFGISEAVAFNLVILLGSLSFDFPACLCSHRKSQNFYLCFIDFCSYTCPYNVVCDYSFGTGFSFFYSSGFYISCIGNKNKFVENAFACFVILSFCHTGKDRRYNTSTYIRFYDIDFG